MKKVNKNSPHYAKTALPYAPFLAVKQPPAPVPASVVPKSYVYALTPAFIRLNSLNPVCCAFTHVLPFLRSLNPASPPLTTISLPLYRVSTPFTSPYRILTFLLRRFHSPYVALPRFNRRFTLFPLPFAPITAL